MTDVAKHRGTSAVSPPAARKNVSREGSRITIESREESSSRIPRPRGERGGREAIYRERFYSLRVSLVLTLDYRG